jgi:hypothetical protein
MGEIRVENTYITHVNAKGRMEASGVQRVVDLRTRPRGMMSSSSNTQTTPTRTPLVRRHLVDLGRSRPVHQNQDKAQPFPYC